MNNGLQQAEVAGGKRVKFLAWALFQTAVLGNWLRNSNLPLLRSLLSWPRSLLSRELGKELGRALSGRLSYVYSWSAVTSRARPSLLPLSVSIAQRPNICSW